MPYPPLPYNGLPPLDFDEPYRPAFPDAALPVPQRVRAARPEPNYAALPDVRPKAAVEPAQPAVPSRTWGEVGSDLLVGVGRGMAGLAGGLANLTDLATFGGTSALAKYAGGALDRALGGPGEGYTLQEGSSQIDQAIGGMESAPLQQRRQQLRDRIAAVGQQGGLSGGLEKAWEAAKGTATDLPMLGQLAAEQVPILATMGVGTIGTASRAGQAAKAAGATPAAIEQAAQQAAIRSNIGFSGAMGAGFSSQQAAQDILTAPQAEIEQSPDYRAMRQAGMNDRAARAELARMAGYPAAAIAGPASALASRLTAPLETAVFRGQFQSGIAPVVGAALRETAEEIPQESSEQIGTNIGVQFAGVPRDAWQNVPEAAGMAGVAGFLMGGALGGVGNIQARARRSGMVDDATQSTAALRANLDFANETDIAEALAGFDRIEASGKLPKNAAERLNAARRQLSAELALRASPASLDEPLDNARGRAGYLGFAERAHELEDDQVFDLAQRPLPDDAPPEFKAARDAYGLEAKRRQDLNEAAYHFEQNPEAVAGVAKVIADIGAGKPLSKGAHGSIDYNLSSLSDNQLTRYRAAGELLLRDHADALGKSRSALGKSLDLLHQEADRRASGQRRDPNAVREADIAQRIAKDAKNAAKMLDGLSPDAMERMAAGLESRAELEPGLADTARQIRERAQQERLKLFNPQGKNQPGILSMLAGLNRPPAPIDFSAERARLSELAKQADALSLERQIEAENQRLDAALAARGNEIIEREAQRRAALNAEIANRGRVVPEDYVPGPREFDNRGGVPEDYVPVGRLGLPAPPGLAALQGDPTGPRDLTRADISRPLGQLGSSRLGLSGLLPAPGQATETAPPTAPPSLSAPDWTAPRRPDIPPASALPAPETRQNERNRPVGPIQPVPGATQAQAQPPVALPSRPEGTAGARPEGAGTEAKGTAGAVASAGRKIAPNDRPLHGSSPAEGKAPPPKPGERYPHGTEEDDQFARWKDVENGRREPDLHERRLMDSVGRALDAGEFYNSNVQAFVERDLGDYLPPNRDDGVEGGANGYEIYNARRVVENERERHANDEAIKAFEVGDIFKSLSFTHQRKSYKMANAKVTSVDAKAGEVTIKGTTAGRKGEIEMTTTALGLKSIIDNSPKQPAKETANKPAKTKPATPQPSQEPRDEKVQAKAEAPVAPADKSAARAADPKTAWNYATRVERAAIMEKAGFGADFTRKKLDSGGWATWGDIPGPNQKRIGDAMADEVAGESDSENPVTPTNKQEKPNLVLWGFKPGTADDPIKIAPFTKSEQKRRNKDGWTTAVYAEGFSPDGLMEQAKAARKPEGAKTDDVRPRESDQSAGRSGVQPGSGPAQGVGYGSKVQRSPFGQPRPLEDLIADGLAQPIEEVEGLLISSEETTEDGETVTRIEINPDTVQAHLDTMDAALGDTLPGFEDRPRLEQDLFVVPHNRTKTDDDLANGTWEATLSRNPNLRVRINTVEVEDENRPVAPPPGVPLVYGQTLDKNNVASELSLYTVDGGKTLFGFVDAIEQANAILKARATVLEEKLSGQHETAEAALDSYFDRSDNKPVYAIKTPDGQIVNWSQSRRQMEERIANAEFTNDPTYTGATVERVTFKSWQARKVAPVVPDIAAQPTETPAWAKEAATIVESRRDAYDTAAREHGNAIIELPKLQAKRWQMRRGSKELARLNKEIGALEREIDEFDRTITDYELAALVLDESVPEWKRVVAAIRLSKATYDTYLGRSMAELGKWPAQLREKFTALVTEANDGKAVAPETLTGIAKRFALGTTYPEREFARSTMRNSWDAGEFARSVRVEVRLSVFGPIGETRGRKQLVALNANKMDPDINRLIGEVGLAVNTAANRDTTVTEFEAEMDALVERGKEIAKEHEAEAQRKAEQAARDEEDRKAAQAELIARWERPLPEKTKDASGNKITIGYPREVGPVRLVPVPLKIKKADSPIKALAPSAAKEDVRYYLNAVRADEKNIVATDGHQLVVVPNASAMPAGFYDSKTGAIKPEAADWKFPNYERVTPKDEDAKATVKGVSLDDLIARINAAVRARSFLAEKVDRDNGATFAVRFAADSSSAYFDAKNLLIALSSLKAATGADTVTARMFAADSSALKLSVTDSSAYAVIMPMRSGDGAWTYVPVDMRAPVKKSVVGKAESRQSSTPVVANDQDEGKSQSAAPKQPELAPAQKNAANRLRSQADALVVIDKSASENAARQSRPSSATTKPATVATARAQLVTALGERNVIALERAGGLVLHATDPTQTGAAGYVDGRGVIHLIPGNMDQDALSVAVHEAMHLARDDRFAEGDRAKVRLAHAALKLGGLKNFVGNPGFSDLVQQVYRMAAEGNAVAVEALNKAKLEAKADPRVDVAEEAVAYLAQYADQKYPLVRRVLAAIRAALYRMGVKVDLTSADVRALALSALKARAKAHATRVANVERLETAFAKKHGWEALGDRRTEVLRRLPSNATLDDFERMAEKALRSSLPDFAPTAADRAEVERQMKAVKEVRDAKGRLLAPNGEPSNLNERQWKQVRTKFFKDWFGDWENDAENASKVVDENGEPLVVYHGGKADFVGIVGSGNFGGAIFVLTSGDNDYGVAKYRLFLRGKVMELADIKTETDHENGRAELGKILKTDDLDVIAMVAESMATDEHYPTDERVWDAIGAIDEADAAKEIQTLRVKFARAMGYESVRQPDEFDGRTLAVVDSAAIKSAIGNAGTFSSRSNRIDYSQPADEAEQERLWAEFQAVRAQFQAKQPETVFKRWFGKGTEGVTARDGKPIILYHGTNNPEFNRWDAVRSGEASHHPTAGLGFFMTADKGAAARYGSRLLELHAKIDKPYYLTDADLTAIETVQDAARLRRELMAKGHDGAVVTAPGSFPYVIVFSSNRAKYIDNLAPTDNEDFRFSKPIFNRNSSSFEESGKGGGLDSNKMGGIGSGVTVGDQADNGINVPPRASGVSGGITVSAQKRKLIIDVPSENWLLQKRKLAETKSADGTPFMGTVTAYYDAPVQVKTSVLARIKGLNDEQNRVRHETLSALKKIMETGSLPKDGKGRYLFPYIEVGHDGVPFVSEGNHRIMAANALGWDTVPVEIRYFDGGEREVGPLNPNEIGRSRETQLASQDFRYSRPGRAPRLGSPRVAAKVLGDIGELRDALKPAEKAKAKIDPRNWAQMLSDLKTNKRPAWLAFLTQDMLLQLAGKHLPAAEVRQFDDASERMDAYEAKIIQNEAFPMAERWQNLMTRDRQQADAMSRLIYMSTWLGVDPRQAAPKNKGAEWTRAKAAYDGLTNPEARKLYGEVLAFYESQTKRLFDELAARIERHSLPEPDKLAAKDMLRQEFERMKQEGPYAPLMRFGDLTVWAEPRKRGEKPVFATFESVTEQRAFADWLKSEGYEPKIGVKMEEIEKRNLPQGDFVGKMAGIIDKTAKGPEAQLLKDAMYQLFLRSMPEQAIRKHFIHRKFVPGYSSDALRTFATFARRSAKQTARLAHADKMGDALDRMAKAVREGAVDDPVAAGHLINELDKSYQWAMNPTTATWASRLTHLGFMWHLGASPAHLLLNLTQQAQVTAPWLAGELAGKKGFGAVAGALLKANKDFIASNPFVDPAKRSASANAARTRLEAEYNGDMGQALKALEEAGKTDKTQTYSVAGLSEEDNFLWTRPLTRKITQGAAWFFHVAEVVNREASAIAAYRLGRQSGMSHEEAYDLARRAINETHFDYSPSNRARFMRGNVAKVITLFKQYSLNVTWQLGRNAYLAARGASPQEKTVARTKLLGMLGVTFAMAGAVGLPFYGEVMWLLTKLLNAARDDDEPEWDADTTVRSLLDGAIGSILGKEAGAVGEQAVRRGLVNAFLGVDLSSRIKFDDLWWRGSDSDLQGKQAAYHALEQLLGPVAGLGVRGFASANDAIDAILSGTSARGATWRAMEGAMPKVIKDISKAFRFQSEGATTFEGARVLEPGELGSAGSVGQLLGFAPASLTERYAENRAMTNLQRRIQRQRDALLDSYAMAYRQNDEEVMAALRKDMAAFNKRYPGKKITDATINQSLKAREKRREEIERYGGVALDKRLAGMLLDGVR